jgi:uncharacterized surface protein with fasciclin (FAS1) repeats
MAALALNTPTPLPTDTPAPTNTAAPTNTPAPTATPAPKDLVDTALSAGNFKTLSALLKTAGLTDVLKGQGPFTIFAPTDDAFAQLSPETLEALNRIRSLRRCWYTSSTAPSRRLTFPNYGQKPGRRLAGDRTADGQAKINDATVTRSDLQTANGVIHTIAQF